MGVVWHEPKHGSQRDVLVGGTVMEDCIILGACQRVGLEEELAETRRQLDEEQRKNIYLELDLEEERSIFEATNNGAKQCAEERDKLRRQRDLLLEAAKGYCGTSAYRHRDRCRAWAPGGKCNCGYAALYDAMKACEPPKPTREELYDTLVGSYAREMRRELDANARKGTWHDMIPQQLMAEVSVHLVRLAAAVGQNDRDKTREYAADVGNLAAMVADVAGALDALGGGGQ